CFVSATTTRIPSPFDFAISKSLGKPGPLSLTDSDIIASVSLVSLTPIRPGGATEQPHDAFERLLGQIQAAYSAEDLLPCALPSRSVGARLHNAQQVGR